MLTVSLHFREVERNRMFVSLITRTTYYPTESKEVSPTWAARRICETLVNHSEIEFSEISISLYSSTWNTTIINTVGKYPTVHYCPLSSFHKHCLTSYVILTPTSLSNSNHTIAVIFIIIKVKVSHECLNPHFYTLTLALKYTHQPRT